MSLYSIRSFRGNEKAESKTQASGRSDRFLPIRVSCGEALARVVKADQCVDQFKRLREVIEEQASRKFFDEQVRVDRPVVLRSNDFSIVASILIEHRKLNDHPMGVEVPHLASLQRHCELSTLKEVTPHAYIEATGASSNSEGPSGI
jgi:hypothetical protein